MLTPGINPNAPPPNIPASRPLPPPGIPGGAPSGGMLGPGPIEPPAPALTRGSQMYNARADYRDEAPGRGKSALKGALQGFLSGGGLAGALTGGVYGAADPRGLREMEFNQKVRPKIAERFAYEDQDRAAQRQGQQDAVEGEYKQAQIGALNRSNLPAPPKPPSYSNAPGMGILNEQTGQITTPAPPQQPRELAPHYDYDVDHLPYNLNNPQERKRYESLPRGKRVKPEKPAAPKEPKKVDRGYVSMDRIRKYMRDNKVSKSEAITDALNDGYKVRE